MFSEPAEKKAKTKAKQVGSGVTVESGDNGEQYDQDKKMSRLLKFNATIKRCPSQIVR